MRLRSIIIFATAAAPASAVEVNVVYLERQTVRPPVLSNLDERPEDLGIAGARLAVEDNASSGKFLGHNYRLEVLQIAP